VLATVLGFLLTRVTPVVALVAFLSVPDVTTRRGEHDGTEG
jgi:hypothetical protein